MSPLHDLDHAPQILMRLPEGPTVTGVDTGDGATQAPSSCDHALRLRFLGGRLCRQSHPGDISDGSRRP